MRNLIIKRLSIIIYYLITLISIQAQHAIGEWNTYLSYNNITYSEPAEDNILYVIGNGALFAYDSEDTSIRTYYKSNPLSDSNISKIAYNKAYHTLVITYSNANIDLLINGEDVYNLSEYMNKNVSLDKTINNISFFNEYAYLSTSFGILAINLKKKEISNAYILNKKVNDCFIKDDSIYIATTEGVYAALLSDNLLDINNWKKISQHIYTYLKNYNSKIIGYIENEGIFNVQLDNYSTSQLVKGEFLYMNIYANKLIVGNKNKALLFQNNLSYQNVSLTKEINHLSYLNNSYWGSYGDIGLIAQKYNQTSGLLEDISSPIMPNSPKRNLFHYMTFTKDNRLLVAGGSLNYAKVVNPGTIMIYDHDEWMSFQEKNIDELTGFKYVNITSIVEDPNDPNHHFAASARHGLYEFHNRKFTKLYNIDNSELQSIFITDPNYVSTNGLIYDKKDNLWLVNNCTSSIIKVIKSDGSWVKLEIPEIERIETFEHMMFDRRGWLWINAMWDNRAYDIPGFFCLNYNNTLEDQSDDKSKFIRSIPNQDGNLITIGHCYCIVEDKEGSIWIGTDKGPLILNNPSRIFNDNFYCTQIKIPRNDGSNLADFLLANDHIITICIDGANRKWIGTKENGVYLLSEDGQETIHHFTKENSPLLSNDITSIVIHPKTGEVFIGTSHGLNSYQNDAIEAGETFADDIYAYPNPVKSDYNGVITVTGLVRDSNVKITTVNGSLVYQGVSLGGQFIWDGKNREGKKVSSGIYMVLAADKEGKEGVVTKIIVIR